MINIIPCNLTIPHMISYLCRSSELHLPSPEESADGFVLLKEVLDPAKGWLENDSLVVELGVPSVGCRTGRISNKWGFIKMEDPKPWVSILKMI